MDFPSGICQLFGDVFGMSGTFGTKDFRLQTGVFGRPTDGRNQPLAGILFSRCGVDNKDLLHAGHTLSHIVFSSVYKNTMYIVTTFSSNSKQMA